MSCAELRDHGGRSVSQCCLQTEAHTTTTRRPQAVRQPAFLGGLRPVGGGHLGVSPGHVTDKLPVALVFLSLGMVTASTLETVPHFHFKEKHSLT